MVDPKIIMNVGLVWDEYSPSVEGQLTRDLIALQNASSVHGVEIQVVSSHHNADRLLRSLGINRLSELVGGEGELESPDLYLIYQVRDKPVSAPFHSTRTIRRVLYRGTSHSNKLLEDHRWNGMPLKEQDRGFYNSQFRRAPPPNNQWSTLDPLVTMVWSR